MKEAFAKYKTVDEAMDEIRKLSLEGYRLRENSDADPKKIINKEEIEHYLAQGEEKPYLNGIQIPLRRGAEPWKCLRLYKRGTSKAPQNNNNGGHTTK